MTIHPSDILDFWYADENQAFWFKSTPDMDADIKARFESTWQQAQDGALDHWKNTAEGCLALTIILDQFPLNMFRGEAKSFSTEQQAVEIAYHAIAAGFDQQLPVAQRAFLYMPLMHSEKLADQNEAVRCFASAGLDNNLRFAKHHRELIRRFGRFPHRNAILGRESTAEELAYLASDEAFTG